MDDDLMVGDRIAYWRRRRGLTQEVLAGLVGRSTSWLSKVERGERIVDRVTVVLAIANVLKVEPGDLIVGLRLPPNGGAPLDPPHGIPAVRRALLPVRAPSVTPPTATALRARVEQAKQLRYDGRHEAVALLLPEVIRGARAAVAQEAPGAWWSLAGASQVASSVARTFGEAELAWIAADRAVTAAQHSGDDLLVAVSERLLSSALMRDGLIDDAGSLCSDGADAIAPTDDTGLAGWSVWGSLQLTQADAAARVGDGVGVRRLLDGARSAAQRVGPGRNDYWEGFGPATVDVYVIMAALEAADPAEALRVADGVELDELPSAESRTRFCIQVARAHALRQDDAATVGLLLEAEHHAPETVRYQVLAREMVRVCLGRERRSRTPGLRGLARRMHVLD